MSANILLIAWKLVKVKDARIWILITTIMQVVVLTKINTFLKLTHQKVMSARSRRIIGILNETFWVATSVKLVE